MSAGRMHFGGLPTDVDVRALNEAFGVPEIGAVMSYVDVAATIKTPAQSSRFRTVTMAWRSRLVREHNIYLRARDGAFTAMSAPERIDLGSLKLRSGVRAMRKAHTVVGSTDRASLSDGEKAKADHVLMVSATVIQSARLQARSKAPVLPSAVGASV